MSDATATLFGSHRPRIESDPHWLARLPMLIGILLAAFGLPLALGAVLAPTVLMRWLPVLQTSGPNSLLALALLGAAVIALRTDRPHLGDLFAGAALLLAVGPLLQALLGLHPADGVLRLILDTRQEPGRADFWPGRMSMFSSIGLMLAAGCLIMLGRLAGGRGVKLWFVALTALFALGLVGVLGPLVELPLLVSPFGESVETGMGTACGLLALVLALFRMAVGAPPVAAYFAGRPDRSVFALSAVGLMGMLVVGGVLTSGLLAGASLQGQRDALAESLRAHLLLADAELRVAGSIAEEARRRAEGGALDWFVAPENLAGARAAAVSIRIEPPGTRAPRDGGLRMPLGRDGEAALTLRAGWWIESRRTLDAERGDIVVEMPFAPFDLLAERIAALGRSGELVVCGQPDGDGMEHCFPTRRIGRAFERMLVQARKPQPTPMARALEGESGVELVRDYRQRRVMAAYAPIAGSAAGVVLKVDVADLQAPLRRTLWGGVLLVLLVALAGGAVVHRHVKPLLLRLSRTERALNRAQAVARVGSWYASARSGSIAWSDETYRIFGAERGTSINHRRVISAIHPDERARVRAAWRSALGGEPHDIEYRILAAGKTRWVRERAEPEFERGGTTPSGTTGTVEDVSERKAREAELLDSRQKLRELAAHHEKLREEERTHIAREIHDEFGQHLTALRMEAALLQLQFGEDHPALAQRVSVMKKSIDRTIQVVRGVASSLRPAALDLGLGSAAEWLVGEFSTRSGVHCELSQPEQELELDDARATVVFRILQESLTNISRHAGASRVEVDIFQLDENVVLEVRDDGGGFDLDEVRGKKTFGLMGIRERARMFGGSARFSSRPGAGTSLRVEIPLKDENAEGVMP
ncbi:histidine kinase [Pseudothauera nasutitermitis]|nr:histidine kinase [Pseudothauera nasutitermitis]